MEGFILKVSSEYTVYYKAPIEFINVYLIIETKRPASVSLAKSFK